MVNNHLKRLKAPKSWGINRKEQKWITRPRPGAHSLDMGISLDSAIKYFLCIAKTSKEIKRMLYHKEVFVDAKPRDEERMIVGLFDTLSFPKINKSYRMIIGENRKLRLIEIDKKENNLKLVKIIGKNLIRGKTQLNCSDSRNILVGKDEFKVGDSLLIDLPGQNIKQHLKLEKGSMIMLTGGKHMGDQGKLEGIEGNNIVYKSSKGKVYQTLKRYAFAIGKEKPAVKISEK